MKRGRDEGITVHLGNSTLDEGAEDYSETVDYDEEWNDESVPEGDEEALLEEYEFEEEGEGEGEHDEGEEDEEEELRTPVNVGRKPLAQDHFGDGDFEELGEEALEEEDEYEEEDIEARPTRKVFMEFSDEPQPTVVTTQPTAVTTQPKIARKKIDLQSLKKQVESSLGKPQSAPATPRLIKTTKPSSTTVSTPLASPPSRSTTTTTTTTHSAARQALRQREAYYQDVIAQWKLKLGSSLIHRVAEEFGVRVTVLGLTEEDGDGVSTAVTEPLPSPPNKLQLQSTAPVKRAPVAVAPRVKVGAGNPQGVKATARPVIRRTISNQQQQQHGPGTSTAIGTTLVTPPPQPQPQPRITLTSIASATSPAVVGSTGKGGKGGVGLQRIQGAMHSAQPPTKRRKLPVSPVPGERTRIASSNGSLVVTTACAPGPAANPLAKAKDRLGKPKPKPVARRGVFGKALSALSDRN